MNSMKYPNPFITAHVAGLLLIALLFGAVKIVLPMLGTYYLYAMVIFTCFVYILTMLLAALALRRIGQPPWYALSGFANGLFPLLLYIFLPYKSLR